MAGEVSRIMKQRIRRRVDDLNGDVFDDAEIYLWLSEAQRDIATRMPDITLPHLCVTKYWGDTSNPLTEGDSTYALPNDFMRERGLKYTRDADKWARRLALRDLPRIVDSLEAAPSDTNPYYWLWNGQINLEVGEVASTDAFTFYYVKYPADYAVSVSTSGTESLDAESGAIADDTDPTISRMYFRAMEEFAVSRCMEVRRNLEAANYFMGIYEKLLAEIKARYVIPGDPADDFPADGVPTRTDTG